MNAQAHRLIAERSQSGSIGVGMQLGAGGTQRGVTVSASASADKSQSAGDGTTYTNAQSVQIEAGADTTLKGAVVQGEQVTAKVGGKLSSEAAQNTASSSAFNEAKKSGLMGSGGLSVTLGKQNKALTNKTKVNRPGY